MTRLGFLYRKYLHGSDLERETVVEVVAVKPVQVLPHPKAEQVTKYCMWVKGLPEDFPNGVLFGPKGEGQLVDVFGNVETSDLKGKQLVLYPYAVTIGGQRMKAIGFRAVKTDPETSTQIDRPSDQQQPVDQPPPVDQNPLDDIPF